MSRVLLLVLAVALLAVAWLLKATLLDEPTATGSNAKSDSQPEDQGGVGPGLAGSGGREELVDGDEALKDEGSPERARKRIAVALAPGTAAPIVRFAGVARDSAGKKLSKVEIVAVSTDAKQTFRTDEHGGFDEMLPAGSYDLLFRSEGLSLSLPDFRVDGSVVDAGRFTLRETGALVVTVVRGSEAVAGVSVRAVPTRGWATYGFATTGSDGTARIDQLPAGRYLLKGEVPDGPRILGDQLNLTAGAELTTTIRLPDEVRFTGSIRAQAGGAAVPNARLELDLMPAGSAGTLLVAFKAGRDGTFDLRVPRGRPTRLLVEADGFASFPSTWKDAHLATLRALEGLSGSAPVHYDIELTTGTMLECAVVNNHDTPMPDVQVAIRGVAAPGCQQLATSDSNGRFTIAHMAPGAYELSVLTPGLFAVDHDALRAAIAPDDKTHAITLIVRTAHRLTGRVVTAQGEGVPAARVWVTGEGLASRVELHEGHVIETYSSPDGLVVVTLLAEAYTDREGRFVLNGLPANQDQRTFARSAKGGDVAAPLDLPSEILEEREPKPLEIVLQPGGEVHGVVVDRETQEPVADVVVHAIAEQYAGLTRESARTGRDGTFRIRGLFPERWRLRPEPVPGYVVHEGDVLSIEPKIVKARLALDPGLVFQGVTVGADGLPLAGVRILVHNMNRSRYVPEWIAHSDEHGRFRVSGVDRRDDLLFVATRSGYREVRYEDLKAGQVDMRLELHPLAPRKLTQAR